MPPQMSLREEVAVDHHRQRLTHANVIEGRLLGVDREVVGAQIRRDLELVLQGSPDELDLVGRHVVERVDSPAWKRRSAAERSSTEMKLTWSILTVRGVMVVRVLHHARSCRSA